MKENGLTCQMVPNECSVTFDSTRRFGRHSMITRHSVGRKQRWRSSTKSSPRDNRFPFFLSLPLSRFPPLLATTLSLRVAIKARRRERERQREGEGGLQSCNEFLTVCVLGERERESVEMAGVRIRKSEREREKNVSLFLSSYSQTVSPNISRSYPLFSSRHSSLLKIQTSTAH